MNGQFIGSDWTEFNFLLVESYSLTGALQPGYNQLGVDVLNMHVVGGLAYAMNITWCQEGHGDPRDHPPVYPPVDEHDHTLEDHHAYGHDEGRGHSDEHEEGRDGHHDEDRCGWCEEEEVHTNANCVYPEYDHADSTSAESSHDHRDDNVPTETDGCSSCGKTDGHTNDCARNGYCGTCGKRGHWSPDCPQKGDGGTSESVSVDDVDETESIEEKSDEGKMTLPELGEEEQLVAAGAGAGSTLSLLGLALRRRLTGGL
jgi:hypothetical protein